MRVLAAIFSDSTGETGAAVVLATMAQFPDIETRQQVFPACLHEQDIDEGLLDLAADEADRVVIFNSLVVPTLADYLKRRAAEKGYIHVDVFSETLRTLEKGLGEAAVRLPGLTRKLTDSYLHRISSIEFAMRYDDGKDPRGLLLADIVLLGVSRTSKTPLSIYLAIKGYNVANLPLVPEIPVPEEIYEVDPRRMVGLSIKPERLLDIRMKRLESMGMAMSSNYGAAERVKSELDYASALFQQLGCTVIDVTNQTIELTAAHIIEQVREVFGAGVRRFADVTD